MMDRGPKATHTPGLTNLRTGQPGGPRPLSTQSSFGAEKERPARHGEAENSFAVFARLYGAGFFRSQGRETQFQLQWRRGSVM